MNLNFNFDKSLYFEELFFVRLVLEKLRDAGTQRSAALENRRKQFLQDEALKKCLRNILA